MIHPSVLTKVTAPHNNRCDTFHEAMRPLTGKWKLEILWQLAQRRQRFGELKRSLAGITQHMLSLRLRELEAEGLVTRTVYEENVLRVEYEISEAVHGLKPVFQAVVDWSERYGPIARRSNAASDLAQDTHSDDLQRDELAA